MEKFKTIFFFCISLTILFSDRWGVCSHQCTDKQEKHINYTCHCGPGFHLTRDNGCMATGTPAGLLLVAEAELRLMSPYKGGITNQLVSKPLAAAPGYKKVDAVDILYEPRKIIAIWTDHQNRRVQSLALDLNVSRVTRELDTNPATLITG